MDISKISVRAADVSDPTVVRVAATMKLDELFKMLAGIAIIGALDVDVRAANVALFTQALRYINKSPLNNVGIPWLGPPVLSDNRSHTFAIGKALAESNWQFHTPSAEEIAAHLSEI